MSITARIVLAAAGLLSLACLAPIASAEPVGTAFTYQGVISGVGGPIDDTLDFRCSLWDDALAGIQFGPTQLIAATTVSGVFTLELDFGADPFEEPDAMWLQVEVSEDGGSNYSSLPRQRLMPSPYSLATRGISVGPDGTIGIGSTDPKRLTMKPGGDIVLEDDPSYLGGSLLSIGNYGSAIEGRSCLTVEHLPSGGGDTFGIFATNGDGTTIHAINYSFSGTSFGVYGEIPFNLAEGWGVFSNGRLGATGTKSFVIDHPLDPANRMLVHYSSEAPEPLNSYSGTAYLDAFGQASIALPDYFESINTDYRYQLTAIGAAAPNLHVATEIQNNLFSIAGGLPGLKVSWEVTATRNDAFVRQLGAPVEVEKAPDERGKYLTPELHGAPSNMRMHAGPARADTSDRSPEKRDR